MMLGLKKVVTSQDGLLNISVGNSRKSKAWKRKQMSWSNLIVNLSRTKYTEERHIDYINMPKEEQDKIKDVGGFVGGILSDGRRIAQNMVSRQLITLDADYASYDFWDNVSMFFGYACCLYSTHKHSKDHPRYRLVIPLDRPVSPDEYQAISRKIAEGLNIDYFDDTTYQPHRLMFWPSTSCDGEFIFEWQDGAWLCADNVLAEYEDWRNQSSWPVSSRVIKLINKSMAKVGDPLTKPGVIGAFCRTYSIAEAISEFLPDIYTPCGEDRYTYSQGSTSGGAVVYEDKYLYSHHSTDPCSMQLLNAFDLVRIHKFQDEDENKHTEDITKLPSYKAMCDFASNDKRVKTALIKGNLPEAAEDFEDLDDDWIQNLKINEKTGKVEATRYNIRIILENDSRLKETFAYDAFSQKIAILKKPKWRSDVDEDKYWTDGDDSELRYLFETVYSIDNKQKIEDELLNVANRNAFHKVREYLNSLKWDGVKRIDTVFIDYLGAKDTQYTRRATRKMCIAAVGRIIQPGLKFDNMVVLQGAQGLGKSYLLKKLGKQWFSDSLSGLQGKEAYEQLRGSWIIEWGELAGMKKNEVETIKQFISKQNDIYRVPYGKRVSEFPRQCIFVGTTNESTFLRDRTGNRRFWPIHVGDYTPSKSLWSDSIDLEIDQIWAEAVEAFNSGESVWIGKEMEEVANTIQKKHTDDNPLVGLIEEFLNTEVPANWYKLDIRTRREFLRGDGFEIDMNGSFKRTRICPAEIWVELMNGDIKNFSANSRKEIREALTELDGWHLYREGYTELSFGKYYGQQRTFVKTGSVDDEVVRKANKKGKNKEKLTKK